ncbi:MAG: preprotein translocase subunit SecE [bacterium]
MNLSESVNKIKKFFEDSYSELRKVSWPPRKESVKAAYAVIVFVVIISFFLGIVDYFLAKIVNWLVG